MGHFLAIWFRNAGAIAFWGLGKCPRLAWGLGQPEDFRDAMFIGPSGITGGEKSTVP